MKMKRWTIVVSLRKLTRWVVLVNQFCCQDTTEHKSTFPITMSGSGIAQNDISDEDREMITTVFAMFDSDGTGTISASELGSIMRSIGRLNVFISDFCI